MYDTYTLVIFSQDGTITFCCLYFDDDATLSELASRISAELAKSELINGEIESFAVYAGQLENLADLDTYERLFIDIC